MKNKYLYIITFVGSILCALHWYIIYPLKYIGFIFIGIGLLMSLMQSKGLLKKFKTMFIHVLIYGLVNVLAVLLIYLMFMK